MLMRTILIPGCRLCRFLWPFTNILSTTSVDLNAAEWSTSPIEHPGELAKEPLGDDLKLSSIQTSCVPGRAGLEQSWNGWQHQFHPMLGPSVPCNDNVKPHTVSGQSFGNEPFSNVVSSTRKGKYAAGQGPTFALSSNDQGLSTTSTYSQNIGHEPFSNIDSSISQGKTAARQNAPFTPLSHTPSSSKLHDESRRTSTSTHDQPFDEDKDVESADTGKNLMTHIGQIIPKTKKQKVRELFNPQNTPRHHDFDPMIAGVPKGKAKTSTAAIYLAQQEEANRYIPGDSILQGYTQIKLLRTYFDKFSATLRSPEHNLDSLQFILKIPDLSAGMFGQLKDKNRFIIRVLTSGESDLPSRSQPQSIVNFEESYYYLIKWMYVLHEERLSKLEIPTLAFRAQHEAMLNWLDKLIFGCDDLVPIWGARKEIRRKSDDEPFDESQIKLINYISHHSEMELLAGSVASDLINSFQTENSSEFHSSSDKKMLNGSLIHYNFFLNI
ncbi:hypothetical protein PGT21_015305 [Puccinia graminis f. sp. tritici]|uniref:Uncharacterized protein n=1 Tax=Puccinia graminis f. sp. tritici TaxID=56615 RepID=A0A5B0NE36_PUCGR|nr:hypothetical protein PGT21_015305 [Puccinia graminis f. sp. tritici]